MNITARVIMQKGRLRVRAADGKNVQCPRDWRETLPCGRPFALDVSLRADGRCYVFTPPLWSSR